MSSLTFYNDIPAALQNPSVSQGQFLQNFASIYGWCGNAPGTDHYTFGTGTDGQHKQVTFPENNIPALTGGKYIPTLFTNIVDGAGNPLPGSVPELFFYSGSVTQSQQNYIVQTAPFYQGSVLLFGGLILKWGTPPPMSSNPQPVSFVSAFPNKCFAANVTNHDSGATINTYSVEGLSSSGFNVRSAIGSAVGSLGNFYYIAIGN